MHFLLKSHESFGWGREKRHQATSRASGLGGQCRRCSRGKGKGALFQGTWVQLTPSNSGEKKKKTSRTSEATESRILNELHLFS